MLSKFLDLVVVFRYNDCLTGEILDIAEMLGDAHTFLKLRGFLEQTADSPDTRAKRVHKAFEDIHSFLNIVKGHKA